MLASELSNISILSRRPVPAVPDDPRVKVIIQKDFGEYDPKALVQLKGANGVVWALGSAHSTLPMKYIKITKDWPLASARAFSRLASEGEPFRFVYVSGGATQSPNLLTPLYGRVKGEAETLLSNPRTPSLLIEPVRPAGVDVSARDAIKPFLPDPGMTCKIMGAVFSLVFRTVVTSMHSPTEPLGKFLVGMAMVKYEQALDAGRHGITTLPGGLRTIDNWAFRRLYEL